MVTFTTSDQLRGAEFVDVDLRDSRFVGSDLSGAVLRGVDVQVTEIDAPWLFDGIELPARQRRRRHPLRRRRARPSLSRPCAPTGRRSRRPADGLGDAGTFLGSPARAGSGHAARHGGHLGGRRVVLRPDAPPPDPGHRHLAPEGGPGGGSALSPHRGDRTGSGRGWSRPVRLHHRVAALTPRCSRCAPSTRRPYATSWPPSVPRSWPCHGRTPGLRSIRKPPCPACT